MINMFETNLFPGSVYCDEYGGYDSDLWIELFILAGDISEDFARRLIYLRKAGCRLQKHKKFGYVIVPVIGKEGWESKEIYDNEKQCLFPYREDLIVIFKILRRQFGEKFKK